MQTTGKPRLIFWETTTGCNLRCIHCRASATELMSPDDLQTQRGLELIKEISEYASPILVLSGGEPLYRKDIFTLARYATDRGLRVALATNGTLVDRRVARNIIDSGVKRVAISLDGACAATHDTFRGIPGSFDAAVNGLRILRDMGMSVQINTTIARHNAHELPQILELARRIEADALHTFLLVPVGCGVSIAEQQMVPPEEYERILNWFYDQSKRGDIELKATCAPHYFRVARQRRAQEREAERLAQIAAATALASSDHIGPVEMAMPGSTGISFKPRNGHGHLGHGDPTAMNAMTKGCLAGSGVCFISHLGDVYPCGYLPVLAGNVNRQSFANIWENAPIFNELRDTSNLKGKCGGCEFRNLCMGCRARAYAASGDYMDPEPFCSYEPRATAR
jgi:radical SAM protein with 4Fe4S-binding SPASM domain